MRTRYYNTDIKRFINRDIVTGDITNSQSLNRYCYVQGNPLKYIDPFGMSPLETLSNGLHTLLDVIGLFQGIAELADLINAIVYAAEGDYTLAVVSVAAIIPGLGILATGAKYGFKSAKKPFVKIAKKLTNYISNSSIGKKLTKTLTKGANDLADEAVDLLSDNVGKNGNKIRNKLKELFSMPKKKGKAVSKQSRKTDFYVKPNGDVVPVTGYRYMSKDANYMNSLKNSMEIPANPNGTYISFDKFDVPSPGKLQVPHDASIRGSFDTLHIIDDIKIPNGKWGQSNWLEPITKDFPKYGPGGATQAVTSQKIKLNTLENLSK